MSAAVPALAAASQTLKPTARADIGAYDLFLLAREKMTQVGTREAYDEAVVLLDRAIGADPDYAPALAWRSYASTMLSDVPGGVGVTPVAESLPVSKAFAERALAADPGSADALFALGSHYGQLAFAEGLEHLDKTIETLKKAVALRPNFPQAENDLAYFLGQKGETAESMSIIADVLARDPGLRDANSIYSAHLRATGRFDEAEAALDKWERVSPGQRDIDIARVGITVTRGALAEAWRQSEKLTGGGVSDNNLDTFRFVARLNLGDGDWIAANATDRRKAWGPILQGDGKRAIDIIDADPLARASAATALSIYVPIHTLAGDAAGVSAYYDKEMGSPAAAIAAARACNCALTPLALALKDAGNKDAKAVLAAWKAFLAERRPLYGKSATFMAQSADVAALEGDFAAAKTLYAAALDAGWRNAFFIDRSFRTFLPKDADFDALFARMKGLIDAERASLGLAPLAP
jgi:tetratricopeptide (TPR) repeat protein